VTGVPDVCSSDLPSFAAEVACVFWVSCLAARLCSGKFIGSGVAALVLTLGSVEVEPLIAMALPP
jgi:hypothetical protein